METITEKKIVNDLKEIKETMTALKEEVDFIKERFKDRLLSDEDKKAIDETLQAEKEGKLVKNVFE